MTTVDIVIPTLLQSAVVLEKCLDSLSRLVLQNIECTVYIVCNCSAPTEHEPKGKWLSSIHEKKHPFEIKWIWNNANLGFAAAMNTGMLLGKAELIFALNDDTSLDKNCLQKIVETYQKTHADMIASTIYLADAKTLDSQGFTFFWRGKAETITQQALTNEKRTDYWLNQPQFFETSSPAFLREPFGPDAAACLYTRQLFKKTAGFDESFFAYLEDVDLALRARQLGMYCVLAEDAIVYHHKHSTSKHWKTFKYQQDLLNWWRICLHRYSGEVWVKFWPLIILERLRNLSGYCKRVLRII